MHLALITHDGSAAPQQPTDYERPIRAGFFARLFATRHDCGGKLLPIAQRGSFLLKLCQACGLIERDTH